MFLTTMIVFWAGGKNESQRKTDDIEQCIDEFGTTDEKLRNALVD